VAAVGTTPIPVFEVSEHLNRQVPPEPHTAMYVWHKYWSRKTWNVVGEFIRTYSQPGEVVFDPLAGSGVTAIEAIRNGRRAIVCDLNPAASEITELTIRSVDLHALRNAFLRVESQVKAKIDELYEIHCVQCANPLVCGAFVRKDASLLEVRYTKCPHCGYRAEHGKPSRSDITHLAAIEGKPTEGWFPTDRLEYPDGSPFLERQHYRSINELFTKRNLQALAWLLETIQQEESPILKRFLLGAFTSMLHLCSRMMPVGRPQSTNHYTYFSSPGWTQHSYWSASTYMEQNVWDKFQSAVTGHQGLINAKEEAQQLLPKCRITNDWRRVLSGKADVAVVTGDCLKLMSDMPSGSVSYIFTDPPYDKSVQYGELSFIWNAWMGLNGGYIRSLVEHEIIHNERQGKNFDVYHALIKQAFERCFSVLQPSRYFTLTFHNPTFKVRNSTVRAGVFAGFEYQKIHHQPLGQVSAKSMLQPFGSAQGDFYLRFQKKRASAVASVPLEEITAERFRKVVIETCKQVIAERAEPTPYTILLNYVDPVLAKHGFFSTLNTGLDVKTVLEEANGIDFQLVDAKLGSASGKQWWFKDPTFIRRLRETPLTERVEQTVLRVLQNRGTVTFTDVWDAVSREFPNSLTSDSTSIKEALETYARKIGSGGHWMLRDDIKERIHIHPEIVAILAIIGRGRGFGVWIGRREQGDHSAIAGGKLAKLVTEKPMELAGVENARDVLAMDVLWLKGGDGVECAFEVESTTTMTSALQRGSNLPPETAKIMVIPEERRDDFTRKMQSPLFKENFTKASWSLLYFDMLRNAYSKRGEYTQLESLLGRPLEKKPPQAESITARQHRLKF